eukprot:m.193742 g.193742  ORF g.193742 m.193742 type:complete len:1135 (+) comp17603_c0_seq1:90-3494(+)
MSSQPAFVTALHKPVPVIFYTESVMTWKKPTRSDGELFLDKSCRMLVITSGGKAVFYKAIESMTDLRLKPFTDESDEQTVSGEELHRFFSVGFYNGPPDFVNVNILSIITQKVADCQSWRHGLRSLIMENTWNSSKLLSFQDRYEILYAELAVFADDRNTVLVKEALSVLGKEIKADFESYLLGINALDKATKRVNLKVFTVEHLMKFDTMSLDNSDIQEEFNSISEGNDYITAAKLRELLVTHQRDVRANEILDPEPNLEHCENIIRTYEPSKVLREKCQLSQAGFQAYLLSKQNDIIVPKRRDLFQDMTHPLAHYFISSSHNTYLTAGQLQSKSTVEMYRQVLLSGCRCIEIDIWDGADGEPKVTHGRTLCTSIEFKKVMESVRDYAFVTTPYPLILSFENHCSPPQMRLMATYCRTILGDMLQTEFLPGHGYNTLPNTLPSPMQLKNKIIIKNKRRKEDLKFNVKQADDTISVSEDDIGLAVPGMKESEEEAQQRIERSGEVAKEMSELVNYCTPYHFTGFSVARANNNCYHISSFQEKRGMRYVASHPSDFVDYTKLQLARVYPAGTRTSSSNFNPQLFWNAGCQLVALNYQTPGYAMQLNTAKFDINGRSGYVLKPSIMTDKAKSFDPLRKDPLEEHVPLDVTVRIISGSNLGESANPMVECQLFGLSCYTGTKFHTRPYRGKSSLARWNADNKTTFQKIILTDLGILRFSVKDSTPEGDELGWACFDLDSVRPGYRYISLRSAKHITARLLVHIGMKIYAPDAHTDFSDRIFNPTVFEGAYTRNMKAMEELIDKEEEADSGNVFQKIETSPQTATLVRDSIDLSGLTLQATFRRTKDFAAMFQQAVAEAMDDTYAKKMKLKLKEKVDKLQAKLDKSLQSVHQKQDKNVRAILNNIDGKLKNIIQAGLVELRNAQKRVSKVKDDIQRLDAQTHVNQVRLRVHDELIDALLNFNKELHEANIQGFREALPLKVNFADQKAKLQRDIQHDTHAKAEKQLQTILDEKAKMVFNEAKKSFDAETWKKMTEDHNRKLVHLSVNAIKRLNQRHQEADEYLEEQIRIEDAFLTDSFAQDQRDGTDRLARLETKLKAWRDGARSKPNLLIWDQDTFFPYIEKEGYIPRSDKGVMHSS